MKSLKFHGSSRLRCWPLPATLVVTLATLLGCSRTSSGSGDGGSPVASASGVPAPRPSGVVNAVPISDEVVTAAVNPRRLAPYAGPVATVRGQITIRGDQPPERPELVKSFSDKCKVGREVYRRLFREGLMRSAADVLVTVTGYEGYVAPKQDVVRVVGRDCAWDRLTVGIMFGQRLEVSSRGAEPYIPSIVGAPAKALMIAVPGGDPVRLYPPRPGRFTLADRVHTGMDAHVFVLKYPTFDITGLDGRYEIQGIPPGEITVGALLPSINKSATQKIKLEAGKTHEVNLEIVFDADKDTPRPLARPAPSGSAAPPKAP